MSSLSPIAALSLPHLLVVDDDARLRGLLESYLTSEGYAVSTAADIASAEGLLNFYRFSALVVDVMLPGEDGVSFTQRFKAQQTTPLLLLTAKGEAAERISGLEAGADDYLPKPFEPRELLLRLASLLRRAGQVGESSSWHLGALTFDWRRGTLRRGDEIVNLSEAEQVLLRTLAAAKGEAVTREALAAAGSVNGEPRAVDVLVTRLRRKIEPDPEQPRYLQTVRGAGYRLVDGG